MLDDVVNFENLSEEEKQKGCIIDNTDKVRNGNAFQEQIYEEVKSYDLKMFVRNKREYHIDDEIGDKESDVEVELESHPNIRIILETTRSLRDDRFWAKESQSILIKGKCKEMGIQVIYAMVTPDNEFFGDKKSEINSIRRLYKITNSGAAKRRKVGDVDFAIRASDVEELIYFIENSRSQNAKRIANNYKIFKELSLIKTTPFLIY